MFARMCACLFLFACVRARLFPCARRPSIFVCEPCSKHTGGGKISRRDYFAVGYFVFQIRAKFPT